MSGRLDFLKRFQPLPAGDSVGEVAILKPPGVAKFNAWQSLQSPLPIAIWLVAGATAVTPSQVDVAVP